MCRLASAANELVPAGTLVEDLWDGAPTPGAASTLQSHVSAVRKVLGADRIRAQAGGYRLVAEPGELDARLVSTLAATARAAARAGAWSDARQQADEALGHYRGEPYVDAGGAAWARGEVSRLGELRLELVELRIDALLVDGDHAAAAAEAEAVLADEPLRERVWAQLMLALHRGDRRAEALRAYQRLRRSLGDELGLEPSPALVALESAIAVDDPAVATGLPWVGEIREATPPAPSGERTPTADSVPLEATDVPPILRDAAEAPTVGRAEPRRVVAAALAALAAGRGGTVVVAGEGGIGKTTLIAQAVCAEPAIAVLYGRCLADGELCYQPFIDALSGAPAVVRRAAGDLLSGLGPLAGPLSGPASGAPLGERSGDTVVDRYLLFQGVERVLGAFADERPVALVIDDLQWADEGTVALARHLADRVADERVLLLIGVRTVDIDPDDAVGGLLADLHRVRRVSRVDLDGLLADDIAELAERFGSPPAIADRLADADRRQPVLRRPSCCATAGSVSMVGRRCRRPSPTWSAAGPGRSGADAARLLAGAAVVGSTFDAALLAEVAELPLDEVLDALDQAVERGLVVEHERPGGIAGFAFAHALAGSRARRDARPPAVGAPCTGEPRSRSAGAAGGPGGARPALAAAATSPTTSPLVVGAACRAGDDALAQLVPSEALGWFDRGLAVLDDGDPVVAEHSTRRRCPVNGPGCSSGEPVPCSTSTTRPPARRCAIAAAAAADSGDAELLAAAALTGSRGFASSLRPIRVRRATLLEQAVEAGPSPATRSRLLADLATELMMVDAARASALAREAIDLARADGGRGRRCSMR